MSAGTAGGVPGGIGHARGLGELLLRLKNSADRVILIGAPILTHVDSMALCPLVDGVVLTVTPGKTHRLDARRAREILDRVGTPLLGVVLTRKAL
jgi:Mrp family chromosome partitioning ATPase